MTPAARPRPLVVGVAGGSGSGKSTVVEELVRGLGPERTAVVHHDAYYRDLSSLDPVERQDVNFDHPDSLETELLVEHLGRLLAGEEVRVPVYDFRTHTREPGPGTPLAPRPVLILDGVLVLSEPRLRELVDLRVFVDTDPDVRLLRRIRRDLTERGRTIDSILDQYERAVRPMHLEFVEPSRRWADVLIGGGGHNRRAVDHLIARIESILAGGA